MEHPVSDNFSVQHHPTACDRKQNQTKCLAGSCFGRVRFSPRSLRLVVLYLDFVIAITARTFRGTLHETVEAGRADPAQRHAKSICTYRGRVCFKGFAVGICLDRSAEIFNHLFY